MRITKLKIVMSLVIIDLYLMTLLAQIPYIDVIKPLETKRADLEARFGLGKGDCRCIYEGTGGKLTAYYPANSCDGGWNVRDDVVIRFVLQPKPAISLASLNENLTTFRKTVDDTTAASYTNPDRGIILRLSPYDELEQIEFIPSIAQGKLQELRCTGSQAYSPMDSVYSPIESFAIRGWPEDVARFDNILYMFAPTENKRLYLFLYLNADAGRLDKGHYVRRLRDRVRKTLGKKAGEVIITSTRTDATPKAEVYLFEAGLPAPTPSAHEVFPLKDVNKPAEEP